MKAFCLTIMAATLLAACAADPELSARKQDRDYVTGSNIPRKPGTAPKVDKVSGEDFDRARDAFAREQAQMGMTR